MAEHTSPQQTVEEYNATATVMSESSQVHEIKITPEMIKAAAAEIGMIFGDDLVTASGHTVELAAEMVLRAACVAQ